MARIEQLIDEIKELKAEKNYKTALRILAILVNNKKLFSEKIESDLLERIIKNYESISYSNIKDQESTSFIREYENTYENLLFHLNKIV